MKAVHRVHLFHWNAGEAAPRIAALKAAGYQITHLKLTGRELLRRLREKPPAAFVIDLTRLPSHGCEVALALRQTKSTRHVPLVFVEGDPEKVARIRTVLPDAVYTAWSCIRSSLHQAIAHPPENPRIPTSVLEGYSGTPLPKKLGIKPNSAVALVGAPADFAKTLGALPEGVKLRTQADGPADLTLWFVRSAKELGRAMPDMTAAGSRAPLWIVWPKKTSGMPTDLTQQEVRDSALAAGLVDYKVCAVDATWSGLLFRMRKTRG